MEDAEDEVQFMLSCLKHSERTIADEQENLKRIQDWLVEAGNIAEYVDGEFVLKGGEK